MLVKVSVQKIAKFGVSISGDTVEVIERPRGGFSVILADGQGSGKGAKRISNLVVNKATALIGEGGRDGAVARTVHDYLYTLRYGKVSCELQILSVDLNTRTLVLSRNCNIPALYLQDGQRQMLEENTPPIGTYELVKPAIKEIPLEEGTRVLIFSDGIWHAGSRKGSRFTGDELFCLMEEATDVNSCAEMVMARARELDGDIPRDDMTVVALEVVPDTGEHRVKKMTVDFPVK